MKYTRGEFCAQMKVVSKDLSKYLTRRKVVLNDSGEIDDADPVNKLFVQKRQIILEKKAVGNTGKKKIEKVKKEPVEKPQNEAFSRENTTRDELLKMDKEKFELALVEKRNAITMQQMEIAKKRGEQIPTEIVRKLVIQQAESSKISYTEACENLLLIFAQKRELSAVEVSDIKKQFIDIVNSAIDNSISITKRNMTEIIKEFSAKRGVGQHG
jgi:hypothetical protein